MSAEHRINELRQKLNYLNHMYYVEAKSVATDYEFDMLLRELQELEALHPEFADPNSPTMRVGSDLTNKFQSVAHAYPMLSLSNTYSQQELQEWMDKTFRESDSQVSVSCELKYDGTAISLTYEDDRLVRAVTRGDGSRGDDVTENVRTIGSVPLTLQQSSGLKTFEVRGEIFMTYPTFDRLNAEREAAGEQLFANPRNAAAGTLKLQQSRIVAERNLQFTAYQVEGRDLPFTSHSESMQALRRYGFPVSTAARICESAEEVEQFIEYWDAERANIPEPIDGVVIKVDSYAVRRALGRTSKAPKWAVAYKFKAEQALTRLNEVTYQVGRTGAITPVANLDPVHLAGTTVKRATLHNADQIEALDLRIGDMVYVEKGGEIIPKVTAVELSQRPADSQPLQYITHCPECGTELVRYEGEAKHYCPNQSHCRPQIVGRIEHFVGRKAMNIQSLGDKIIEHLCSSGHIKNVDDLYKLEKDVIANTKTITNLTLKEAEKLYNNIHSGKKTNHQVVKKLIADGEDVYNASIDRLMDVSFEKNIGEKTAEKIIENIKESTQVPFHRVLFALGIRFVGETTAKYLASHFKSLDAIINASKDELIEAEEVGDKIADAIIEYFNDSENMNIIHNLTSFGLKFQEEIKENKSNSLKGLTIVVSGVFNSIERDALKALIAEHGGKVTSSVSASTSYLVAGNNAGPSKLEKANKLGVEIISEKQIMEMIGIDNAQKTLSEIKVSQNTRPNINTNYKTTLAQNTTFKVSNTIDDFNFVVIDCETAYHSEEECEICSIGIVVIENGIIVEKIYKRVRPKYDFIFNKNQEKHNITINDVINEPFFPEVWLKIEHYFENTTIIAHNAKGAELAYLSKLLINYNLHIPTFNYIDSCDILPGAKLEEACSTLGIKMEHPHHALYDALDCAKCFIKYFEAFKGKWDKVDYKEYLQKFCNKFDSDFAKRIYNQSLTDNPRRKLLDYDIHCDNNQKKLFKNKVLYLSGNFDKKNLRSDLFKAEIASFVKSQCGQICDKVDSNTTLVVLGERDSKYGDTKSKNHQAAEKLNIRCVKLDIFLKELYALTKESSYIMGDLFADF